MHRCLRADPPLEECMKTGEALGGVHGNGGGEGRLAGMVGVG